MKKASTIIIGVLLIAGLTGLRLYKKHQKAEIKAEQEAIQREQAKKYLQDQREQAVLKMQEEEHRRNDSIANARMQKMNEGRQRLKEAMESLNKQK